MEEAIYLYADLPALLDARMYCNTPKHDNYENLCVCFLIKYNQFMLANQIFLYNLTGHTGLDVMQWALLFAILRNFYLLLAL